MARVMWSWYCEVAFKESMTTHSPAGSAAESLEADLTTLKSAARRADTDGGSQLLTAYSGLFENAIALLRNWLEEPNGQHDCCTTEDLLRLAQSHGLIESQARWDTYLRFHQMIEDKWYPDIAPTILRYLPAFALDVEMLAVSVRNTNSPVKMPSLKSTLSHEKK
jgi:hypothetical protein